MTAIEINMDGLVGPTHNYSGLSYGNVASLGNAAASSNPREAARQGIAKMQRMHELGLAQSVLPPQDRPHVQVLRKLGFRGTDAEAIAEAARCAPRLLAACGSASAMWTANAATVSPSADTADGRVHITPANLVNKFHRSIEPETTRRVLKAVFPDGPHFAHHDPLPAVTQLGDEGAANHMRLCTGHGRPGLEVFVHGRDGFGVRGTAATRFPARQTREAGEAIARLHRLDPVRTLFLKQHAGAIDAGVFHNDVIAVANENALFQHEYAFEDETVLERALDRIFGTGACHRIVVPAKRISLQTAVQTYLFNSQLITMPSGDMTLVVPSECMQSAPVAEYLEELVQWDTPIRGLEVMDLRQSMRNGGGPACLRLRVVLTRAECSAMRPEVMYSDQLGQRLLAWVDRHYRDRLLPAELADPALSRESRTALDELSTILGLGSVYPFQLE